MFYLPSPTCSICNLRNVQLSDYNGHWVCLVCLSRVQAYERRVEGRIERLQNRADKAADEAQAGWNRAHQMADAIPFGQPILVGHHSERRDRNYRDRIWNTQKRAYERGKEAEDLERRAHAAETNHAVSSDDPAAVLKLQEKLDKLVALQDEMKCLNSLVRKVIGRPEQMQVVGHHGTVDEINARFRAERERVKAIHQGYLTKAPELAQLAGISETRALQLLTPDMLNRFGIPDYAIKNNGAEIRRLQKRIAELKDKQNAPTIEPSSETFGDLRIERDTDENRLRLKFPCKPGAHIINNLKRNGFHWSPSNMAWQRQLNNAGEYALSQVKEFIQKQ